jgi:hypothetical protein
MVKPELYLKLPFANGYVASVVRHDFSYGGKQGLFEVAVMDKDFNILYDTPITTDVVGHLNSDELVKVLQDISNLPNIQE